MFEKQYVSTIDFVGYLKLELEVLKQFLKNNDFNEQSPLQIYKLVCWLDAFLEHFGLSDFLQESWDSKAHFLVNTFFIICTRCAVHLKVYCT